MSASSDKLAQAINKLPFATAVEHEQQASAVNVLCRVKPGCGVLWAAIAEKILREAAKRQGTADFWHTHIARVYMLRNNKLVYGWTFVVMSQNPDKSVDIVANILTQITQERAPRVSKQIPTQPEQESVTLDYYDNDDEDSEGEDDDYTDSDGPLPVGAVPEADEMGNPIVPRFARVKKVLMAGLPKNFDRNAPDPEKRKGSWQIGSRKGQMFRPPVRT